MLVTHPFPLHRNNQNYLHTFAHGPWVEEVEQIYPQLRTTDLKMHFDHQKKKKG